MIELKNVTLQRGAKQLFDSVTLTFYDKHKIGVVGNNGCGKSSLFSLLLHEFEPEQGDVCINADTRIVSVEQEVPNVNTPTIEYIIDVDKKLRELQHNLEKAQQENNGEEIALLYALLADIDGFTATARDAKLLFGLGFSDEQMTLPVNSLSGGWRERLNLARALFLPSDVLLLDEPTNHLDLETVIWLEKWLAKYQGLLLLISHDREFLDSTVRSILHFHNKEVKLYSGNYSSFEKQYADALELQQKQHVKQQKKVAHLQSYIDRFRAKATKSKQAQSRIKALEKMKVIEAAHVDSPFSFEFFEPKNRAHLLTNIEKMNFGYGENEVLENVYFRIENGMRVGLLGENGAGKSTLIKILADELSVNGGVKENAQNLMIGYFAQHSLEQLTPELSSLAHLQEIAPKMTELALRKYLGGFAFVGDMALSPVGHFSGGEKARLALALIIFKKPNLLLLDEPTNHLDLDMRQALVIALQNFEGAMVIVSHDRFLLRNTVDEYYLVAEKNVTLFKEGLEGYQKYLSRQNTNEKKEGKAKLTSGNPKKQRREVAARKEKLKPIRQQIRAAETKVEGFNQQLFEIDQQLSTAEIHQEGQKERLQQILIQRSQIQKQMHEVEALWVNLSEELETIT